MSELVRKSHNVSILIYHYVCPAKYRRAGIDKEVDEIIKGTCWRSKSDMKYNFSRLGQTRIMCIF